MLGSPGDHDVRHCPSVDPLVPQNTEQTLPLLSPPMASNSPWIEAMAPDHASPILRVKSVQVRSPWHYSPIPLTVSLASASARSGSAGCHLPPWPRVPPTPRRRKHRHRRTHSTRPETSWRG